jgi:hypothetical protein
MSSNYYSPYITKSDYNKAFHDAYNWVIENPKELPHVAARIFHVRENSLRNKLSRLQRRTRNSNGVYNTHGGHNSILSDAQEEAVRQYCYEQ